MKYLSIFFVGLMIFVNAQQQRFMYEYRFAGNKSQLDNFYTELMALDITDTGSKFYSLDKIKADSLRRAAYQKQIRSGQFKIMDRDERSKVSDQVSKTYPEYEIKLTKYIGRDVYIVSDTRTIDWQITSESKKIGEWSSQKAVADFAGRKWEAWFTMGIPIPDGPYKFRGLPGMIVRVESQDGTHTYQLVSVKNLTLLDKLTGNTPKKSGRFRRQPLKVTSKQFVKQRDKFYDDPTAELRQRFSGRKSFKFGMQNKDGSQMTAKDLEKLILDRVRKEQEENSNPVELDMIN